jgi:hypothetical protein
MTYNNPEGYVSVIGTSYLFPIADLLGELNSLNTKGPNEVQASPRENGYSTAIIILTVLLLESAISRTQYVRGEKPPKKPLEFIKNNYPGSGYSESLEELFVLRDVIAHNHLWEAKFYWDENMGMKLLAAGIIEGYGDTKFKKVRNSTSRMTRLLNLNLFPTRICRSDCITVLKNATEFLLFLEDKDRNYIYLSPQYVMYLGKLRPFVDIVNEL